MLRFLSYLSLVVATCIVPLHATNARDAIKEHGMVQKNVAHLKVPHNNPKAKKFSFASVGDQDYQFFNSDLYPFATQLAWKQVIRDINNSKAKFTLHVGDLGTPLDGEDDTGQGFDMCKPGSVTLRQKLAVIQNFKRGFVYTPGDNEWADCAIAVPVGVLSYGFPLPDFNIIPVDQLNEVRSLFFPDPNKSLGKDKQIRLIRQENYPENVMFFYGDVLYVTLNIAGSAQGEETNNCPAFVYDIDSSPGIPTGFPNLYVLSDCDETEARNAANAEWLIAAFKAAHHGNARGVVVAFQADLFVEHKEVSFSPYFGEIEQYTAYIQLINDLGCAFKGEVLVNHGDSHIYNVDPGTLYRCENITRLEVFGPFIPPNGHEEDELPPDAKEANTRWFQVNVNDKGCKNHLFTFDAFDANAALPIHAPIQQYRFGTSGRACMDLKFWYNGPYKAVVHGLVPPVVNTGSLTMDPNGLFPPVMTVEEIRTELVDPGYAAEIDITVPPGTVHLEIFSNANAQNIGDDFDIYLFGPNDEFLGYSFLSGQNERIVYTFPAPGEYKVFVDAYLTANPGPSNYEVSYWVVQNSTGNLHVTESPKGACIARDSELCYKWSNLAPGTLYMGAITHEDGSGNVKGTTVLKIQE